MTKKTYLKLLAGIATLASAFMFNGASAFAEGGITISENTFPNEVFREYVSDKFDLNQNGILEEEEIEKAEKVDLQAFVRSDLDSIKGIEYLTNLESLDCSKLKIRTIDLSKNKALRFLFCNTCDLTNLDVSALSELEILYCKENSLAEIDVSNNTKLTGLYCDHNKLTELDVTKNKSLLYLSCEHNMVKELNVKENPDLSHIGCSFNELTELNVDANQALCNLWCEGNNISELNISCCPPLLETVAKGEKYVDPSLEQEDLEVAGYFYQSPEFSFCSLVLNSTTVLITDKMPMDEITFPDVPETAWYYGVVKFVAENGFMKGKANSDGSLYFAPNDPITRAEFATVLYSKEGKPDVEYTEQFGDVKDGKWFTKPVMWAFRSGIAKGYGNNLFGVSDNITREQMAQMFYAYAKFKGYDMNVDGVELDRFADPDQVSSWAVTAMKWATSRGVISGTGDAIPKLNPLGSATRAECAAMIRSFVQKVETN